MGALGFTAAVGASSFSSSTLLNFQNFGIEDVVEGVGSDGFTFSGNGAKFVQTGDDIAVSLTTTIGPFDDDEKLAGLPASSLAQPLPESPFFSIEADAFESFEFVSVELGGNVFDLSEDGFVVRAFGQKVGSGYFDAFLPQDVPAGTVGASAFGLAKTPLTSLGFSLGAGTSPAPAVLSDEGPALAELVIDDIEVLTTTPVPIPASALLLATALLWAGAFARRRT
jgi:hypothetical protein